MCVFVCVCVCAAVIEDLMILRNLDALSLKQSKKEEMKSYSEPGYVINNSIDNEGIDEGHIRGEEEGN